jgi:hypothetical protein
MLVHCCIIFIIIKTFFLLSNDCYNSSTTIKGRYLKLKQFSFLFILVLINRVSTFLFFRHFCLSTKFRFITLVSKGLYITLTQHSSLLHSHTHTSSFDILIFDIFTFRNFYVSTFLPFDILIFDIFILRHFYFSTKFRFTLGKGLGNVFENLP